MDWTYFTLDAQGNLRDEDGDLAGNFPKFASVLEAESYLEENDIRGSVRA
jgi:hypothetical protein